VHLWLVFALCASALRGQDSVAQRQEPDKLTFAELVQLSGEAVPAGELGTKLQRILSTPVIGNSVSAKPRRPEWPGLGPLLRTTMWNIERGHEFDLVRLALGDPDGFMRAVAGRLDEAKTSIEPAKLAEIRKQAALLRDSDLIILNEVDWGMTRTEYRDIARELAAALEMNYAYGVEFVEVDKLYLGTERLDLTDDKQEDDFALALKPDESRYLGFHGTVVLSRYPISKARIHRLRRCYDWYGKEKSEIASLEKGKRLAAERVFLERISREVRHGGRMALIAELDVPESPTKKVTVVATHLENKCVPKCRVTQTLDLLNQVREIQGPVILAGDMNTTGADAAPTSIRREVAKRVKNPKFWAVQAVNWFSPVTIPRMFTMPANYFKNYQDPTAQSIPLVLPNRESKLFSELGDFRFADGKVFDRRGDSERTVNGRDGKLANSNERTLKGFKPTFSFKRDFKGLAGEMRLDWIFVKAMTDDDKGSYWFAPHFGTVLDELNESVPDGISDHHPVMTDIPLTDPGAAPPASRK